MSDSTGAVTPNTIGETRVGTQFNPSASGDVDVIKQRTAELINLCDRLKGKDSRLVALAQTLYEEAATWEVKAAAA
jgi:hypothetical protein